jgi:hypothetical protein
MITLPEFQKVRLATIEMHWEEKHLDPPEEQREAQVKPVALYIYSQIYPKNWYQFYECH